MTITVPSGRSGLEAMLRRFICPTCAARLKAHPDGLSCEVCEHCYPVHGGIPILLPPALDSQKLSQSSFFDTDVDPDWEIARPFGAPALYRHLLEERFARATRGLELPGTTALVICGGSGMDAQFLARAGASVTTSDLSYGAARRALARAQKFGFGLVSVVADVEQLPFRDRSFDLVYVHDGLHHLERPKRALDEMTRVAARAVAVTEPARAAVTQVALRVGLALEREEAGNRVARLTLTDVTSHLEACGFRTLRPHRYGMLYRHVPGRLSHAFSAPWVLPVALAMLRFSNAFAGRLGNKLAVQAVRR